jgi:hypothetical protein
MSFLNYALDHMIDQDNLLVKIDKLVDWIGLSDLLNSTLGKRMQSVAGKPVWWLAKTEYSGPLRQDN